MTLVVNYSLQFIIIHQYWFINKCTQWSVNGEEKRKKVFSAKPCSGLMQACTPPQNSFSFPRPILHQALGGSSYFSWTTKNLPQPLCLRKRAVCPASTLQSRTPFLDPMALYPSKVPRGGRLQSILLSHVKLLPAAQVPRLTPCVFRSGRQSVGPGCFSGSVVKAPWCQAEQAVEYVGLESRGEVTVVPTWCYSLTLIAKPRFSAKETENGNKIP